MISFMTIVFFRSIPGVDDEDTSNKKGFFGKSRSKSKEKEPKKVVSLASLVSNNSFIYVY